MMTMMTRMLALAGLVCCCGCDPDATEVKLVDNGVAKCRIVVADDASKAVRFAGRWGRPPNCVR